MENNINFGTGKNFLTGYKKQGALIIKENIHKFNF